MGMFKARFLLPAYHDLLEIEETLKEYPNKVRNLFDEIEKRIPLIEENPEMYPIYDDFPAYRKVVVMDYLLFYKINKQKKTVSIQRIIYGRMNIKEQLKDN